MILIGERIFVIFWPLDKCAPEFVLILVNIDGYITRVEKCIIWTKLDQHVSGMMTAAGNYFYNF